MDNEKSFLAPRKTLTRSTLYVILRLMGKPRVLLILLLLLVGLSACAPGHTGTNVLAYLRDGKVWTADPDGNNAFAVISPNTEVIGYSWSPDHHIFAFRSLDPEFAKTPAARQIARHPLTGLVADMPALVQTVGVDGGYPIAVAFSNPHTQYSNPEWNKAGTRLVFRRSQVSESVPLESRTWLVTQNDQPGEIAARYLPGTYSIPSLSYQNNLVAANSEQGLYTSTQEATDQHFLTREVLPGHPLPASLERVLWQPNSNDSSVLYAIKAGPQKEGERLQVQLILHTLSSGKTTTVTTCTCTQFAWAPDGKSILYSDSNDLFLLDLQTKATLTLPKAGNSVPYWSPDSRFLLLDGDNSLQLVEPAQKRITTLLSAEHSKKQASSVILSSPEALLQPVTNNIWFSNSRQFLFLTRDRLLWQGHPLQQGNGLYTITIDTTGNPQGQPVQAASGNIQQAGWAYQDANTSFLF